MEYYHILTKLLHIQKANNKSIEELLEKLKNDIKNIKDEYLKNIQSDRMKHLDEIKAIINEESKPNTYPQDFIHYLTTEYTSNKNGTFSIITKEETIEEIYDKYLTLNQ